MDVEILIGVVIVHGEGHIKIHAAQRLHDLPHGLPLDNHVKVRHHAGEVAHLGLEALYSLLGGVDGVDALDVPGDIHHGVPGDAHKAGLLVGHVIGGQHNSVGAAAGGVLPQEEEGKEVLLTPACGFRLVLRLRRDILPFLLRLLLNLRGLDLLADVRRLDEDRPPRAHRQSQDRHAAQGNDRPPLPAGEPLFLFFRAVGGKGIAAPVPCLPARLTSASLSAHAMIPFK